MAYVIGLDCSGCGTCIEECPTQSIKEDKRGNIIIDPESCSECGICTEVCPLEVPKAG